MLAVERWRPGVNFIGYTEDGPATHTLEVEWISAKPVLRTLQFAPRPLPPTLPLLERLR